MTRLNDILTMLHMDCEDTRELAGISDDSREIEKDWLFVCRKGVTHNGDQFLDAALRKGAVVLCERDRQQPAGTKELYSKDVYVCENIEHILQALIFLYYGELSEHFCIVGITGTSGKTSTASITTHLLRSCGKKVLRIGTHEVDFGDHIEEIRNTTPGSLQLANYLRRALRLGITHIVMEVSSHAIDQNRICFLSFDIIVYTNITQDHLDYHLTSVHYRYTKFKLRRYLKKQGTMILNSDQQELLELAELSEAGMITIGTQAAHLMIQEVALRVEGSSFQFANHPFSMRLLGMMNVYNACEALAICYRLQLPLSLLQKALVEVPFIPGRMEILEGVKHIVWIDYAHTPDAVEKLMSFARSLCKGKLYGIVGCGGDRDRSKRVLMADAACKYCDTAIFTSDNPRYEAVSQILLDMCQTDYSNYEVIENRQFAIKYTVTKAMDSDIIVIAGKGNEGTQEIEGMLYPFDDRSCVKDISA